MAEGEKTFADESESHDDCRRCAGNPPVRCEGSGVALLAIPHRVFLRDGRPKPSLIQDVWGKVMAASSSGSEVVIMLHHLQF